VLKIVRNDETGYICLEGGLGTPSEVKVGRVTHVDNGWKELTLPATIWNEHGEEVAEALRVIWDAVAK